MSEQGIEEGFSYDGQLVFNGLYSTDVLNSGVEFEQVAENELNDFGRGEPESPSKGYELLEFTNYAAESEFLSKNLREGVEDIHALRRKYEQWDTRENRSGEIIDVREIDHYDVYWDFPEYLFVKGNKTQASRASEIVGYTLGDYLSSREIEFHPDFILWLFYQFKSGKSRLNEDFKINLLSDTEIKGDREDRYGKRSRVDKSTDITKSTTALIGILRGKDLTTLEGVFEVQDKYVKANIEVGGRVHIKASHAIEGSDQLERMCLAIMFLRELLSLFEYWENLPGEEKYPPVDFFTELYEECEKQGAELTFSYDDVIEIYRQKRSQGVGTEKQSGLVDFI